MIEVRTPCRLHFGLLARDPAAGRQFGGAGLMIAHPGSVVRFGAAAPRAANAAAVEGVPAIDGFTASGRMADRALDYARRFAAEANRRGLGELAGADLRVLRVPRPHTGLGAGTQLGMAVALGLARLINQPSLDVETLASLVGRGRRSAIGAHGCIRGGFLVDGGKATASALGTPDSLAPLLFRYDFPDAWRIVLIRPRALEGLAGQRELEAFQTLPAVPAELTDRMCRLVLLGLAPALLERDVDAFGEVLYQLQLAAGETFAAAQGGLFADPSLGEIVAHVRRQGVRGIGQSSWGPSLYAITPDNESAEQLANDIEARFGLSAPGEVIVTAADNHGSVIRQVQQSKTTLD
ncbi:MAG: beta-RFAP synthase [Planctomycetota bacterium]|nr:beta-RFAP synthase [Planctomycetota bacterium]